MNLMSGTDVGVLSLGAVPGNIAVRRSSIDPFLKWAGGKRQLLNEIRRRMPTEYGAYYEPFVGGGAIFFGTLHTPALISDTNQELINCYRVVRDQVEALIEDLRRHENAETYFYALRSVQPETLTPVERASRFIYLNRTCFNGLYRVNRKGQFNVPYGKYKNPALVPADKLKAASTNLQGVEIEMSDYKGAVSTAEAGDFVYLDPPYIPLGGFADFKRYNSDVFGVEQHEEMAALLDDLDGRGVKFMVSNSDTPLSRELYRNWKIDTVTAKRLINCDATKREGALEVIVTNY